MKSQINNTLEEIIKDPEFGASINKLAQALKAILGASRNRAMAEDRELNYNDAAEILLILKEM